DARAELRGVDEVAVVAQGDRPDASVVEERLRVLPGVATGRRVAVVPDRQVALQAGEAPLVEDLRDEPEIAERGQAPRLADGDPGRLLAPVLQREEAEVREPGNVATRRPDTEDAAHLGHDPQLDDIVPGGCLR